MFGVPSATWPRPSSACRTPQNSLHFGPIDEQREGDHQRTDQQEPDDPHDPQVDSGRPTCRGGDSSPPRWLGTGAERRRFCVWSCCAKHTEVAPGVHLARIGRPWRCRRRRNVRRCDDESRRAAAGRASSALPGSSSAASSGLARLELQHGRQEMGQSLGHVKGGAISFGARGGPAVLALITLLIFIILGPRRADRLARLAVGPHRVRGARRCWPPSSAGGGYRQDRQVKVKPDETIASVKEDIAWAKRLIRRE